MSIQTTNGPWNYPLLMLRAGLFCLNASALAAALLVSQGDTSFPGELAIITLWSLPFAFSIALSIPLVVVLFSSLPRLICYVLAILFGMVAGYIWERIVYTLFVNPFFGSFSVPVFFAWLAGGVSGMIAVAGWGSRAHKGDLILELLLAGSLTVLIGLGSQALVSSIYQARQVNVVWIKWKPRPGEVVLGRHVQEELTAAELESIRAIGLHGELLWEGTSNEDKGPISRMVIILQKPVETPVDLRLSKEEPVIYIQKTDGSFTMIPPEAPLLRRTLRLAQLPDLPWITSGYLRVLQGTAIFGGVDWGKDSVP